MRTLYKELRAVNRIRTLFMAYIISFLVGAGIIYVLFMLGHNLQIFGIVIVWRAVMLPYYLLKMRLPLFKELYTIKNDPDACWHERKEYRSLIAAIWRADYFRALAFAYVFTGLELILIVIVCIIIYTAETVGIADALGIADAFDTGSLFYICGLTAFVSVMALLQARNYGYVLELCEEGDNFLER